MFCFIKRFLKRLLKMACQKCNESKITLNNCDCDFTVDTDCVEYKGDKLSVEPNVRNGSSRTLTSIIESIDDSLCTRSVKIVEGDYEVQLEDTCKILFLNGALSNAENKTYVITLPETDDFFNQTIILKDISETDTPSGDVFWEFSSPIIYNKGGVSTDEFSKLAWGPHKVLHLTFLKKDGVNYSWVVTSPSIGIPEVINFSNDDLSGDWQIASGSYLTLYRLGNHRQLQGMVTGGEVPSTLLVLDAIDHPASPGGYFLAAVDASPYRALLTLSTSISISFPGGTDLVSGEQLSLFGISWYVE
jgi:hypothetical protein